MQHVKYGTHRTPCFRQRLILRWLLLLPVLIHYNTHHFIFRVVVCSWSKKATLLRVHPYSSRRATPLPTSRTQLSPIHLDLLIAASSLLAHHCTCIVSCVHATRESGVVLAAARSMNMPDMALQSRGSSFMAREKGSSPKERLTQSTALPTSAGVRERYDIEPAPTAWRSAADAAIAVVLWWHRFVPAGQKEEVPGEAR